MWLVELAYSEANQGLSRLIFEDCFKMGQKGLFMSKMGAEGTDFF